MNPNYTTERCFNVACRQRAWLGWALGLILGLQLIHIFFSQAAVRVLRLAIDTRPQHVSKDVVLDLIDMLLQEHGCGDAPKQGEPALDAVAGVCRIEEENKGANRQKK